MRRLIALALVALAAPAFAQENEAEKIYRGFEKKLKSAKAYKVAFEQESAKDSTLKVKGEVTVAAGNKLKMSFEGTEGDKPIAGLFVSDGTKLIQRFNKVATRTDDSPEQLTPYFTGYLAFAGLYVALDEALRPRKQMSPERYKLTGFKLGAKEKVAGRDAQIVEFKLEVPRGDGKPTVKIWFDVQTQEPLKRFLQVEDEGKVYFRTTEYYTNWQFDPKLKDEEFQLPK
jgi:outer membrane lipoprotein-sorting protein